MVRFPTAEVPVRVAVVLLFLSLCGAAAPVAAQVPDSLETKALFLKRDLWFAGGFVVGTIAMFPLDRYLATELRDSTLLTNDVVRWSANAVGDFGRTGPFIIGPMLLAVGKLTGSERIADLGLHGTEAILVAEVANRVIKAVAGRARPYMVGDDSPSDFDLLRGFGNHHYQSFVSGHSAVAFAAAAAVVQETEEWWPRWKPAIGAVMFGGASLVALSRIYDNKHWASDVVAGAAIGSFAGWKVVRWNHANPENRLSRWILGVRAVPGPDGRVALVWMIPAPR